MHTRISLWIFAALIVMLSAFVVDVRRTYAQEEEEVVVTQVFVISNNSSNGQRNNNARSNAQPCEVTAELRWYKNKKVRVIYHWQACTETPTDINRVRWEIVSIRTAYGNLALSTATGEANVYNETWSDLAAGDKITLRTWINDVRQADVVTEYQENFPIWTRIHTRDDQGGACFQFTGHVDPWGVFTAGDHSYVFELTADDWETPWLEGPNQPTVDWHVVFYRDAALTQVRSEYWFNDVANPCYSEPLSCDDIALSIPNGDVIPEGGANVEVTITGQNGTHYRIVDPAGTEVAGPSVDNVLSFHAMPGITYQAQVYREGYGWTQSGCQFAYATAPRPACNGVELSIPTTELIPQAGADVQVTINGQHGTHYRIIDAAGAVVVGPSTENKLQLHVMGKIRYQAQVYNAAYGWTSTGCTFEYTPVYAEAACVSVALIPQRGVFIPDTGANVQATISVTNTTPYPLQYRIVDESGAEMAGPSDSNQLSMYAMPLVNYQAEVYDHTRGWVTSKGCAFDYKASPPVTTCESIALSIPSGASIPEGGAEVQVTITGKNAVHYRIVDSAGTIMAGPSEDNVLSFHAMPDMAYQAQVANAALNWTNQGCQFVYYPAVPLCNGVALSIANGSSIPESGAEVEVTVDAENATNYQIVDGAGTVVVGPSSNNRLSFHAMPATVYQAQVADESLKWTSKGCQFVYDPSVPICKGVTLSIPNGSPIPESGADVEVTVTAENATLYRLVDEAGAVVAGPSETPTFQFHALPFVTYQAQVSNATHDWTNSGCQFEYGIENTPSCEGVDLSIPNESKIDASGTDVQVTINGRNATDYRIVDGKGNTMAGPSSDPVLHFHAMPSAVYQAQVANATYAWTTNGCQFRYVTDDTTALAFCELHASHYGDPGGISRITAWVEDKTTVAIEKIEVNWNHRGTVTYPTKEQSGPWFTNTPFELDSRPDVYDVGFGYYRFEASVYVAGITEPAYCTGDGNAPDHDNVLPDPGPFAKANPEGKFDRGSAPSRLPTVGRLPFDGGNGPDKVELILWAFEKEGRGLDARITAIANEGKPLARIGMESVSNVVKFDGLNAREGIVYGFQIGEHGPWSPLFCPKADGDPTTITVYWAAGGQTWLSDSAAFGDCWWLTVAAALNGWVTVDESVATYNALQDIIDWNGHRNLTFSLAQSQETGLGPRMQDEVIGLTSREWQGPVIPTIIPPDFWQVVDGYRNAK